MRIAESGRMMGPEVRRWVQGGSLGRPVLSSAFTSRGRSWTRRAHASERLKADEGIVGLGIRSKLIAVAANDSSEGHCMLRAAGQHMARCRPAGEKVAFSKRPQEAGQFRMLGVSGWPQLTKPFPYGGAHFNLPNIGDFLLESNLTEFDPELHWGLPMLGGRR